MKTDPGDAPTMKVLVSTSTFPLVEDDGLPRFVYDLAAALGQRCETTVLAPDAPGAARSERLGGLDVHRFSYFVPRRWQALAYGHGMRDNLRQFAMAKVQPLPYVLAQTRALRTLVRRKGIEVVNSHWMIPQGLSAALAAGARRPFRHVLSVHAGDVYLLEKLPFGPRVARFIARRTDWTFVDGSHVKGKLDELLGCDSGATIQPMGVRGALFRGEDGAAAMPSPFPDGYLVFVGRFVEKKGARYLLEALPRVVERFPEMGLVLVGYGPLEGALREDAARLGIEASVRFVGAKPHEEVARYLRGCRAAVVPSIVDSHGETEGMPTVVVEAMAAGARVVGCAVDGIPDLIEAGRTGWLCREKDAGDLAEKILLALESPAAAAIAQAALETGLGLDWTVVASRYYDAFAHVLAG